MFDAVRAGGGVRDNLVKIFLVSFVHAVIVSATSAWWWNLGTAIHCKVREGIKKTTEVAMYGREMDCSASEPCAEGKESRCAPTFLPFGNGTSWWQQEQERTEQAASADDRAQSLHSWQVGVGRRWSVLVPSLLLCSCCCRVAIISDTMPSSRTAVDVTRQLLQFVFLWFPFRFSFSRFLIFPLSEVLPILRYLTLNQIFRYLMILLLNFDKTNKEEEMIDSGGG